MIIHGSRKDTLIGLSFDDGPDIGEKELIFALNTVGMKATFFWIPEKVERFLSENPTEFRELVGLLIIGGHEIGLHGLICKKPNLLARFFPERLESTIKARDKFSVWFGHMPIVYRPHCIRLFRAPKNMKAILGSRYLGTCARPIKYLLAFAKAKPGDIICGHSSRDCSMNFGQASKIATIVPEISKILKKRGFRAVTVSEVIKGR